MGYLCVCSVWHFNLIFKNSILSKCDIADILPIEEEQVLVLPGFYLGSTGEFLWAYNQRMLDSHIHRQVK